MLPYFYPHSDQLTFPKQTIFLFMLILNKYLMRSKIQWQKDKKRI